jgi:uncharacterized protein YjbI with pentapeptide repeats
MSDFDFGRSAEIYRDLVKSSIQGYNIDQIVTGRTLDNVTFQMCNLTGTRFINSQLIGCSFYKMILGQVAFFNCNMNATKFYHATWDALVLVDCDLTNVEFKDFDEPAAKPFFTFLINCNTFGTTFINYDMSRINMIGCYSKDTTLAAEESIAEDTNSIADQVNFDIPNPVRI